MTRFDERYSAFLHEYAYPRQLRSYKVSTFPDAVVFHQQRKLIDFASSDYLGLAKHPFLIARSHEFAKRYGTGAGASRLVRGSLSILEPIEEKLAQAVGKEAALIFGTGFQANVSVLEALTDPALFKIEPLILADKACHTSMYVLARKNFHRFRHNDLNHLRELLEKRREPEQPVFILAESLYSMEGDQADLAALSQLASDYQATLYIDDAHAFGMLGNQGFGSALQYSAGIDVIMATFSKALGGFGAFVALSKTARDYLVHRCKGLIYSTALPPPVLGAISAAIELLPELEEVRLNTLKRADELRAFMKQLELNTGHSSSHIVPWIIGPADKTRQIAALLEEEGILATAIQAPSVPPHQNRIRFCISALHQENDFNLLFSALKKIKGLALA